MRHGAARLRTAITHAGQPYVDEPVYAYPKMPTPIECAIASAFGSSQPAPIAVGTERVRLNWVKPPPKS